MAFLLCNKEQVFHQDIGRLQIGASLYCSTNNHAIWEMQSIHNTLSNSAVWGETTGILETCCIMASKTNKEQLQVVRQYDKCWTTLTYWTPEHSIFHIPHPPIYSASPHVIHELELQLVIVCNTQSEISHFTIYNVQTRCSSGSLLIATKSTWWSRKSPCLA